MSLIDQPYVQMNMASGQAYSGAKAYFTQSGTTTPIAVYQDNALTTPHPNPVVANSEGRFPAIFAASSPAVRMRITSATGDIAFPLVDIDPVSGSASVTPDGATPGRNLLLNSMMSVSQQFGTTTPNVSNDTYDLDQWYVLNQTASTSVQQVTAPENGFVYSRHQVQTQVAAQRFGFAQILEGGKCKHLRASTATFTPRIRISSGQKVNYAVLGWTGTEDIVTSDVVNNWANAVLTAGNFFLAANLAVLGVASATPSADTWTTLPGLTVNCGTAFTNIIVFVWTDQPAATNVYLDCDAAMFEQGSAFSAFPSIDPSDELARCQRFFQKRTWTGTDQIAVVSGYGTTHVWGKLFDILPRMRISPTLTMDGPNLVVFDVSGVGNAGVAASTYGVQGSGGLCVSLLTSTLASGVAAAGSANIITPNGTTQSFTLSSRL